MEKSWKFINQEVVGGGKMQKNPKKKKN